MPRVRVENLITHESAIYCMSRVPAVGETVCTSLDGPCHEVRDVIHVLLPAGEKNPDLLDAIVRVR